VNEWCVVLRGKGKDVVDQIYRYVSVGSIVLSWLHTTSLAAK
jgi:hypothetical protein